MELIRREAIYLWYYCSVQFHQMFPYWVFGMVMGSLVSVFLKKHIHAMMASLQSRSMGICGILPASALGILSPLCMYGTVPIVASIARSGMRKDWIAAFMMSSILLNPQLLFYSFALGTELAVLRLLLCFLGGCLAGLAVRACFQKKPFYIFTAFDLPGDHDTEPSLLLRLLKNLWRNVKATGLYFLLGILLSALFQRYVPAEAFASLFGENEGFGVLMAATIGVPLYVCGGGTIPLLQQWLWDGMSVGAATSFMITGPSTKITNLGALKIVLGAKRFFLYIAFVIVFSLVCGWVVNIF